MIVKNMKKYFSFEVQVRQSQNLVTRCKVCKLAHILGPDFFT